MNCCNHIFYLRKFKFFANKVNLVIILSLVAELVNCTNKEYEEQVQLLLLRIAQDFPECEFLYFQYNQRESWSESDLDSFSFHKINGNSAGAYFLEGEKFNLTYERNLNIHRYTAGQCSLAIFSFTSYSENVEKTVFRNLFPRYAPILRKDEDHFIIFCSEEQACDQFLLSPTFGMKIKFKIAIYRNNLNENSVQLKSVNLYGGPQGNPELVYPDISNPSAYLFYDMTKNFNGKKFMFCVPKVEFRLEIRADSNGKYHPVRGYYRWYLEEAIRKYNFTYHMFYASYGGGTGKKLDNGTWVGALGDVLYGKCEIGTMIGLIYSRHKYISWSSALSYEWMVFMTPSPKSYYSPKAIFWAFTPGLWLAFSLSLIISAVAFKLIIGNKNAWTYSLTFDFIYATFLEQDKINKLNGTMSSLKVLAAFWLLFALVTGTVYRGKLVSVIAFPVNSWVPTTFDELANSDFKVALNLVGKAGAAYAWVVSSPSPVIRKLAARLEYIGAGEKCLMRAMQGNLGCMLWKGLSDYFTVRNLTDKNGYVPLQQSKETAMFIIDGFNFEKRAVHGRMFDRSIDAAIQMGLAGKWFQMDQDFVRKERKEWIQRENIEGTVYDMDDGGAKELKLAQLAGLFGICLVGIVGAGFQFGREILRNCRRKRNVDSLLIEMF